MKESKTEMSDWLKWKQKKKKPFSFHSFFFFLSFLKGTYPGRVDVLEATQHLVEEILEVWVRELLARANDLVHVCLHELLNDVDFIEGLIITQLEHIQHIGDVLVALELPQELDLTQSPLGDDFPVKDLERMKEKN